MKYNVLILGSGFLGSGIKNNISKKFKTKIINKNKIHHFIKNSNKFSEFLIKSKINIIFNCIGDTRKNMSFKNYINPNIKIPLKILHLISKTNITFINFSSQDEDKVKSIFKKKLFPEYNNYNYAISKYIFTMILKKNLFENYIINLTIPIIYGKKSPKHMLYGEAEECFKRGKKFVIKNPSFLNNFISMQDFVNIIELLILNLLYKKKYCHNVISNNKPQTVRDFVLSKFPNIKIDNKIKKKISVKNKTLITKNKLIIDYFK